MINYKSLPTVSLKHVDRIERPDYSEPLTTESSALEVLLDFREQQPMMLESSTPLNEAIELMKRTHEKVKLVIDSEETFRGVISLADLLSVKVMKASQSTGMHHHELTVGDVMIPRNTLRAVEYTELCSARVGDLLSTMKNYGDRFVLVVDGKTNSLRGLIGSGAIARGLRIPILIGERANTFSDIYHAVRV
ncbi:CBS domain-containing protein [Haliea sp. E17]|uniref:CBS domain-containing protein n=1 Tax=Haliea sp. E17 TaxID=3401576 RepID=UPI003AABB2CE